MAALSQLIIQFIHQYGFFAVFIYMFLETAFVLHFAPSEVVVPVAATLLVHNVFTFVLFVLDATAGALGGSLAIYYLFNRYGMEELERYGTYLHISPERVERADRWFLRWGESSVFWGRLLPLLRAVISVPAGLADMNLRKFAIYSGAGALLFNTIITYLVYTGSQVDSPVNLVLQEVLTFLRVEQQYIQIHLPLLIVEAVLVLGIAGWAWWKHDWILSHPDDAKMIVIRAIRILGSLTGLALIETGFTIPQKAYPFVTYIWNDVTVLTQLGATQGEALIITGVLLIIAVLLLFEIGWRISIESLVTKLRTLQNQS